MCSCHAKVVICQEGNGMSLPCCVEMTVQINTSCKVIAWLFFGHGKTLNLGLILNLSNEVSAAGEEQPARLLFWAVIKTNQDNDWSKLTDAIVNNVETTASVFYA